MVLRGHLSLVKSFQVCGEIVDALRVKELNTTGVEPTFEM